MDNNDSNIKPHQTGGLKLMTVFVVVLVAHVLALGSITTYYLLKGPSADADLATTDKTHKDLKGADGSVVADGSMPDASQGDKSAPSTTPSTEVAAAPANPPALTPDPAAPTITAAPAPVPDASVTPAPAPTPTAAKPAPLAPPTEVADQGAQTPSGPISPELAPPAEPALAPVAPAPAPSVPVVSGPVHMPPAASPEPVSRQIYVVKITDSYKKIAHAHHITVAQLKEANHIKTDVLHTGQKLVIPSSRTLVAATASVPVLDSTPTGPILSESAAPMTTGLTTAAPAAMTTALHSRLYTVVKGDTLIRIAHRFKTTSSALMAENNITDPTKLAIGKKLRIPSAESRSARVSPPASTQPAQVQAKENTPSENAPSGQLANFVP